MTDTAPACPPPDDSPTIQTANWPARRLEIEQTLEGLAEASRGQTLPVRLCWEILRALAARDRRIAELETALRGIIDSGALSTVEGVVAGWRGPIDDPYERHPSRLGATISTNCGCMYRLADALEVARTALGPRRQRRRHDDDDPQC